MNERIRELIVSLEPDAFMTYKGYLYHSSDPKVLEHSDPEPLYTQQELEKFAELIIKECLDQCYNRGMNDALYAGQLQAAAYIEQHFGVEELPNG